MKFKVGDVVQTPSLLDPNKIFFGYIHFIPYNNSYDIIALDHDNDEHPINRFENNITLVTDRKKIDQIKLWMIKRRLGVA